MSETGRAGDATPMNTNEEKIIQVCSTFDCGGKCVIKAHVRDGVVTRISTIPASEMDPEMPTSKLCPRGMNYHKLLYHPDRLKYPMKRVGKRGEGKFERITWDEAIDTITSELTRITKTYGPASRFMQLSTVLTGGVFSGDTMAKRLLNLTGGHLGFYHSVSLGNTEVATTYTYGTPFSGSSMDTLLDTKLVILWGHNPAETIFGHTNYYFKKMKENGTRFVVIDPRASATVRDLDAEWIPILPATDNALSDAMAYVIVTENLYDKEFVEKFCVGFDESQMPEGVPASEALVPYLLGKTDGTPKTPAWAEKICKIPAATIEALARDYAKTKPAAIIQGWGPQRHICGERTARGAINLAVITGNVGKRGGWAVGCGLNSANVGPIAPSTLENPVKASINIMNWLQAADDASKVTPANGLANAEKLDSNIKMIFNMGGNYLANQNPDINKTVRILEDESKVEFILVSELFLSPSAKYADILLPELTFMERWNLGGAWVVGSYLTLGEKIVEPEFERRSDYEWLTEVARKLGLEKEFTEGRSEAEWIKYLYEETRRILSNENLPDFETMRKKGIHYFHSGAGHVAFKDQIEDLAKNPFPTPSGKIEIFSKALYDMKNPEIPGVAKYIPAAEGSADPLTAKFPLQMFSWKSIIRSNSTFYPVKELKDTYAQALWINPKDAQARNISSGDLVLIFNDRGKMKLPANVTEDITPGVVAIPDGAWWNPDKDGVDLGGCANTLTSDRQTPLTKGNAHHTFLVEVSK